MRLIMAAITAALLVAIASPSEACQRVLDNSGRQICAGPVSIVSGSNLADANGNEARVVGRRPKGCPHRYCGCSASLYLFGKIKPELNLAANWMRLFPRTSPAPQMAAARRGHVMVLLSHVSGSDWLVHDGNSGGGLTRVHVRSIRGYTVVNPHSRVAER